MFKKIKIKIKRGLAGFLKEELLEFIGYDHTFRFQSLNDRFCIDKVEFETVFLEQRIGLFDGRGMDDQVEFERHIEKIKESFCREIMDHIHVDVDNLTNPEFAFQRSITLKLRIQKKQ